MNSLDNKKISSASTAIDNFDLSWEDYNSMTCGYNANDFIIPGSLMKVNISKAEILDFNNKERTYIIFDMDVLEEISKICIPEAEEAEFQIHYEALRLEIKNIFDKRCVNIVIPLCYYNFKQEVTSSSVEFECKDIEEMYNKIKDTVDISALQPIKELLNAAYNKYAINGYIFSSYRGDFGSIHRHPGRITFSNTDLRNDPENPGVVYRKNKFNGVQTDSILYVPKNNAEDTELYHSEARRVDIDKAENGGCKGTYQEHTTINVMYRKDNWLLNNDTVDFNDILNLEIKENVSEISDTREHYYYVDVKEEKNQLLSTIMQLYHESEFKPDISNVNADNITKLVFQYPTLQNYASSGGKTVKKEILLHVYDKTTNEYRETVELNASIEWYSMNSDPYITVYVGNEMYQNLYFSSYSQYETTTNSEYYLPDNLKDAIIKIDIADLFKELEVEVLYPKYTDRAFVNFIKDNLLDNSNNAIELYCDIHKTDGLNMHMICEYLSIKFIYDEEKNEFFITDIYVNEVTDNDNLAGEYKHMQYDNDLKKFTYKDYVIHFDITKPLKEFQKTFHYENLSYYRYIYI